MTAKRETEIVTLAEWDAASTEQRNEWLKDGHILTNDDAERLRLRYKTCGCGLTGLPFTHQPNCEVSR